jgi:hypothetical protein
MPFILLGTKTSFIGLRRERKEERKKKMLLCIWFISQPSPPGIFTGFVEPSLSDFRMPTPILSFSAILNFHLSTKKATPFFKTKK